MTKSPPEKQARLAWLTELIARRIQYMGFVLIVFFFAINLIVAYFRGWPPTTFKPFYFIGGLILAFVWYVFFLFTDGLRKRDRASFVAVGILTAFVTLASATVVHRIAGFGNILDAPSYSALANGDEADATVNDVKSSDNRRDETIISSFGMFITAFTALVTVFSILFAIHSLKAAADSAKTSADALQATKDQNRIAVRHTFQQMLLDLNKMEIENPTLALMASTERLPDCLNLDDGEKAKALAVLDNFNYYRINMFESVFTYFSDIRRFGNLNERESSQEKSLVEKIELESDYAWKGYLTFVISHSRKTVEILRRESSIQVYNRSLLNAAYNSSLIISKRIELLREMDFKKGVINLPKDERIVGTESLWEIDRLDRAKVIDFWAKLDSIKEERTPHLVNENIFGQCNICDSTCAYKALLDGIFGSNVPTDVQEIRDEIVENLTEKVRNYAKVELGLKILNSNNQEEDQAKMGTSDYPVETDFFWNVSSANELYLYPLSKKLV